jgi:hypothetical protein
MTRILSVFNLLKRVWFAVLFLLGLNTITQAQPPDTMWTRVYPGLGDPWSFGSTADGGFIVISTVGIPSDAVLTKIDSAGNLEWSRVYVTDNWGDLTNVIQTSDGGYVAVGARFGHPHHFDYATYLLRTDSNGDTLWSREYNLDENNDQLLSVISIGDDFLCVGRVGAAGVTVDSGDVLIMKINSAGDTLWTKQYGTAFPDIAYDIIRLSNGHYLVAGRAGDQNSLQQLPTEAFALLINGEGDSLWMNTYSIDTYMQCYDAEPDGESGFLLTGVARTVRSGYGDVYVMRGDSTGGLVWQDRYGGDFTQIGRGLNANILGGSVVFCSQGPTDENAGRFITIRLTDDGDTTWTKAYTGPLGGPYDYSCIDGAILPDGGYLMMGIQAVPVPEISGVLLIRTYPEGLDVSEPAPVPGKITLLSAYPNPFNATTTIQYTLTASSTAEIMLYDLLGRRVQLCPKRLPNFPSYARNSNANSRS